MKILIFHWFLQYILLGRLLQEIQISAAIEAQHSFKKALKTDMQKVEISCKIYKILLKIMEKMKFAKKASSGTEFYRFLVDFGVPRGAKNPPT